ncbi:tRNA pseudouridine(55) synthase TruB [Campylobacter sp. TTU-622]|uniref:tRNA pseudouridine(55) synthase TruB n=1 Tax=Campylobacter sp. TTU-622 TaxID=2800583 RepID=UPI0019053E62|nr:tRNA pseudouridine(55) synthase TruB [Campylobacter sp. TTU-622]MBK1973088.1 tRNA pseudouridine(55) synthase TruB [Campylobacter sp. TTU-622]
MNKLFVGYKPSGMSSNAFLNSIKKKYKVKKAGYSGTLDPFAKGVLIIAFNQFSKLFRFLKKTPKIYRATLWLGVKSLSLDDKNITQVKIIDSYNLDFLEKIKNELLGEIEFIPPQFSAKRIQGKRAYEFAKKGQNVELKPCKMYIYECKILHYNHPFLTIELSVSEGAYIRSYCEIFAKKIGINATLSALERVKEGEFFYNNEKSLNVLQYLNLKKNFLKDSDKLENGIKIDIKELTYQENGTYYLEEKNFFSIINIENNKVNYILNKVAKC